MAREESQKSGEQSKSLLDLMVRNVLDNPQGEYSAEEVARVREAREQGSEELARVLADIHRGRATMPDS